MDTVSFYQEVSPEPPTPTPTQIPEIFPWATPTARPSTGESPVDIELGEQDVEDFIYIITDEIVLAYQRSPELGDVFSGIIVAVMILFMLFSIWAKIRGDGGD